MEYAYDPIFEDELEREINGLEKEDIMDTLIIAISKVAKPLEGENYARVRFVLSLNEGIQDYVYDVKYKIYCRLPLYRSAAALVKYGNILIREKKELFVDSIDVLNYLKKMEKETEEEMKKLSKSKSKMAAERLQVFQKKLDRIRRAIRYLTAP